MKRYVIHSAELGVYLAPIGYQNCSTLWAHPEDSDEIAATFPSIECIEQHIASWPGPPPVDWRAVEVEADGAGRATLAACVVAGLPMLPEEERQEGDVWDRMQGFKPGGEGERRAGWVEDATVLPGGKG